MTDTTPRSDAPPPQSPPPDFDVHRLVHEPARLGILTVLSSVRSAEFLFLQSTLGLSKGNLSSYLSKLEQGGLVAITKKFVGKKPQTSASLTESGLAAIDRCCASPTTCATSAARPADPAG